MIELILRSGLGNQMFQYAYAKKMQMQLGDNQIVINNRYMQLYDFREYALYHFSLAQNIRVLNDTEADRELRKFYLRLPYAFGKDFISWRLLKQKALGKDKFEKRGKRGVFYAHFPYEYYPICSTSSPTKYVFGFFQNSLTVMDIIPELQADFQIITPASKENEEMLQMIRGEEAVCVHIRRGDYLDEKWKAMQVCDYNYYKTAIEQAKSELYNPVFYIFSNCHDDIEWIKGNYRFDEKVKYVDLSNPDFEELRLMMACKHYIISNSTFSWWAALLSTSEKKIVWCPSMWRRDQPEANAVIVDEWRKILV